MTLLVFYLLLAIGVSFLCSILESVLLSLTPSFINALSRSKDRKGQLLRKLKEDVEKPLAAILTLNTAAHTIGAAGVGAQAHVVFQHLPTTIISGVLTLLILIFSEIIPKTLGANHWRAIAIPSGYIIHWLTIVMMPFVFMSQLISRFFAPAKENDSISREEMVSMADMGQEQGVIDASEGKVLRSVMKFQSLKVRDVLTPRTVVESIKSDLTIREIIDSMGELAFSRYPVLQNSEQIEGYVLKHDILAQAADDNWEKSINEFIRPVTLVLESTLLKRLMTLFLKEKEHLAVVIDEFGTFVGIVTLEDVIESLIGLEIMDEVDSVEDMRSLALKKRLSRTDLKILDKSEV